MAHSRPWYKRAGGDFVIGAMVLPDNDTRWAYSCIVDMLNDHDRELPDDPGFLCGLCSISRRKWPAVRAALIQHGKIIVTDDGYITNPRFMREKAERDADRERSVQAGREGGKKSAAKRAAQQGDLPLSGPLTGDKPEINGTLSPDNVAHAKPQKLKTKEKIQPPPQPSRAREEARGQESIPTTTTKTSSSGGGVVDGSKPDDLLELTRRCCDAAGMTARIGSRPALLTQSMDIVKGWIAAGIDITGTAIPVIEAQTLNAAEPAHSLNRFAAAVDTRHSRERHKAKSGNGKLAPPPTPVFDFTDEPAEIAKFRHALAQRITPAKYARFCSGVRFSIADRVKDGDRQILHMTKRANGSGYVSPVAILDEFRGPLIATARAELGVRDVWDK